MKTIATILLGLILSVPVQASEDTVHDLHLGCEAWARIATPAENKHDVMLGASTHGYIAGFAAATPDLDLPATHGEVVDAVCKDIDLHPAMWKLPQATGLLVILHNLYGTPSKESK
jgi:hypothetical protein